MYEFAHELVTAQRVSDQRVSDERYAAAVDLLGEAGAVELVGILGYYTLVCMTLNAFEVPLGEGMDPALHGSAVALRVRAAEETKSIQETAVMDYRYVNFEIDGGVARMTLNRPEAMNALHIDMCKEMMDVSIRCDEDPAVRALLVDAKGRMFSAGGDLRAFAGHGENLGPGHQGK